MAVDMYMKISGNNAIEGDCTDDKHQKWIQIHSYNHGLTQMGGGDSSGQGHLTGGRADHSDVSILKNLDSSSPLLAEACCKGHSVGQVDIEVCRAMGEKTTFMVVTLVNAVISGFAASAGGELPTESVSFRYEEIKWKYTPTDTNGNQTGAAIGRGWSTKTNKPVAVS